MVRGILAWFVFVVAASSGAQTVTEILLSDPHSAPGAIVRGPDGNLWFTERQPNKIGVIPSSGGSATEYAAATVTDGGLTLRTQCITNGPDGNLWYLGTEAGSGYVGRITTAGAATAVSAVIHSRLFSITSGPDGNLWFTEATFGASKIGRLTTAGILTEYAVPSPNGTFSAVSGIVAGPDGSLWFPEPDTNKIGRITTSGVISEYPLAAGSQPAGIAVGPDGALWFTEQGANQIGRMTTDGTLTGEYPIPTANSATQGITSGPDGNLWFTESSGNKVGRITPAGQVTEFPVPTASSAPFGITAAPGSIWFTEGGAGKIGQISGLASGPTPTPTPPPTPTPTPTPANGPSLHISKTDDGQPWIDSQGTVHYTIVYSNNGNATAHDVRLTEHPDPQENFYGGGGFDSSGVMEIGDLASGASGTVSLDVGVDLNPDDPKNQLYDVHNEVEITGSATEQNVSASAGVHTFEKLFDPGLIDNAAEITVACGDSQACQCVLTYLWELFHPQGAVRLAQTAAQDLLLYYRVRDRVLAQSPGGKRYIDLYYRHSSEIKGLVAADASLRNLASSAMDAWAPGLEALVEGLGGGSTVTQAMSDSMTALLEKLKQVGSADLRSDIQQEQAALNLPSLVGQPMDQASRKIDQRPCVAGADHLCLNNGRFRVDVAWRVPEQQKSGVGTARSLTGDTGYFWFFDSANVELVVKVLDATAFNHHFWVFYGALSDVAYTITVTDTQTGVVRTFANPDHHLASFADTSAFAASADSTTLDPRFESRVTAEEVEKLSTTELYALYGALTQTAPAPKAAAAPCAAGTETLCLNGNRFQVQVSWSAPSQGKSGEGQAVPVTGDTGYFWFFSDNNVELIVKVLDGRALNGHFWVFYGALSNVQYTITVKDTQTGDERTYENPDGSQASHADTSAF